MMTESPDRSSEIAAYRLAVERHLSDLQAVERDELLADLESHLEEVASELEPGASLADRVGSPEAYARELRDAMAVEREGSKVRLRRSLEQVFAPVANRVRRVADRFAVSSGAEDAGSLRRALKPGWWVLRGVLVAMLFAYWLSAMQIVVGYSLFNSFAGFLILSAVTIFSVWLSLKLGVRSEHWQRRRQLMLAAGGWLLGLFVVSQYSAMVTGFSLLDIAPTNYVYDEIDRYEHVTDVYVYDADGNLLTGVYLFDQHGEPLLLGDPHRCEGMRPDTPFNAWSDEDSTGAEIDWSRDERLGYQYPLCLLVVEPSEEPLDDPTAAAEPSETPEAPADEPTDAPSEEPDGEPTPGAADELTDAPTEDAKDTDEE
jgi:hypothetical protein